MLSYYVIYYEKSRNAMQRTEKEALIIGTNLDWVNLLLIIGYLTQHANGTCVNIEQL